MSIGVRTSAVRTIAKAFFPQVQALPLPPFLEACEALLIVGTVEHRCIAFAWAYRRRKALGPENFDTLFTWLCNYVHDWAACDQLCCEVFGAFMIRYPVHASKVIDWAGSDNRWLRRAAAVVLIPDLRGAATFLPLILQVATTLLSDRDDLVQKGYGWALKEAMETRPAETWAFVLAHKAAMSRTALRYAIEKCSPAQKAAAMNPASADIFPHS